MVKYGLVSAVCLILLASLEARAGEVLRMRASGIGYAPSLCQGTARGRLMAERAAKIVATRNLAGMAIRAPRFGAFGTHVPGVRVVRRAPTPDGGVAATVEVIPRITCIREKHFEWLVW